MKADALVVAAEATITAADDVPAVAGFIESRFAPMLREVARRCLGGPGGPNNLVAGHGDRTAILLASVFGDSTTLDVAGEKLAAGTMLDPLLFHQTVPTAILGLIARDYDITGPITCFAAPGDLCRESLEMAELLLADEADQVLLVLVELAATERVRLVLDRLVVDRPGEERAHAVLLRRRSSLPA